ncbi:MAG: hypothetical protein ACTTID_04230 [Bacillales bacterium]
MKLLSILILNASVLSSFNLIPNSLENNNNNNNNNNETIKRFIFPQHKHYDSGKQYLRDHRNNFITNGIYFNVHFHLINNTFKADCFKFDIAFGLDNYSCNGDISFNKKVFLDITGSFTFFGGSEPIGIEGLGEYNDNDDFDFRSNYIYYSKNDKDYFISTDDKAEPGNSEVYKEFKNESGYYDGAFAKGLKFFITCSYEYSETKIYTYANDFYIYF